MALVGERLQYQEVLRIEGSGEYRFVKDPNQPQKYDGGYGYSDSLTSEPPLIAYKLPKYLKEKFPYIGSQRFHPARLVGGEYTPARFEYFARWNPSYNENEVVMLDGEIYSIVHSYPGSNDDSFSIEDIGNLLVVKNKLVVQEPDGRDGKFSINIHGGSTRYNSVEYWRGFMEVDGNNPGKLVQEAIDYINGVKESNSIPLWKKVVFTK